MNSCAVLNECALGSALSIASHDFVPLRSFVELVEEAQSVEFVSTILGREDFYQVIDPVSNLGIFDLLFPESPPDRDLFLRVQLALGRCDFSLPVVPLAFGVDFETTGQERGPVTAAVVCAFFSWPDNHHYSFLVVLDNLPASKSGTFYSSGYRIPGTFLSSKNDWQIVARHLLSFARSDEEVKELCQPSFEKLIVLEGAMPSRLGLQWEEALQNWSRHLSWLNDCFLDQAEEANWRIDQQIALAAARSNIDFSDESPNTKRDTKKMKSRDVEYCGRVFRCTLHTKIRWNVGRIHFCPPGPHLPFLLVGIATPHLPT